MIYPKIFICMNLVLDDDDGCLVIIKNIVKVDLRFLEIRSDELTCVLHVKWSNCLISIVISTYD